MWHKDSKIHRLGITHIRIKWKMKNKKWERDHGKPLEEEQKKERDAIQGKARQGGRKSGFVLFIKMIGYDTIWYDFWNEMTEQNDEQRAKETEKAC